VILWMVYERRLGMEDWGVQVTRLGVIMITYTMFFYFLLNICYDIAVYRQADTSCKYIFLTLEFQVLFPVVYSISM